MATEVWWIDPPRSVLAGGYMTWKEHDAEIETVYHHTQNPYYVGFDCIKQWSIPFLSDHYECWSYHTFIQFHLPAQASGTLVSAELYLMVGYAENIMNVVAHYQDIDIYYKNVMDYLDFPWDYLTELDYDDGTWTKNAVSIEDMWELWGDFMVEGPHWIGPFDVTSGVALALGYGWDRTAFKLTPNYRTPLDWDYDERPTPYDQKLWVSFYGAINPYWVESPTGFPDAFVSPVPWLKLTYSGVDIPPQYVPGEDVTTSGQGSEILCVSADPKAKMGIIGANTGSLWYCWSGGGEWNKIYEADEPITAVHMDYLKNFLDYPTTEIAWFGTASGNLYKSVDSLTTWDLNYSFPSAIVEIKASQLDSNKVVVGVEDGVWVTMDGGTTWREALEAPTTE